MKSYIKYRSFVLLSKDGLARPTLHDIKIFISEPVRLLVQKLDESQKPLQAPYSSRQVQIICYHNSILSGMFHSNHDKGTCERYTLTKRLLERVLPVICGAETVLSFWVLFLFFLLFLFFSYCFRFFSFPSLFSFKYG